MNNDQLVRQIDELERALLRDDPSWSKRFRELQQVDTRNDVAVFSLLAISAVLLAVAVATLSLAASCVGVAAYVASFLVDTRHERSLRGPIPGRNEGHNMAVTPIQARCRRCHEDFRLHEVLDHRRATCPRCGWILSPDWTVKLLEDAAVADIAQRHLVGSLRNLRNLPGNVLLRPHTVLRNLFEEVGWERDLTDHPEMLREELQELRRLINAWELLDPAVAAAQPPRTRFRRAIDLLTGRRTEPTVLRTTPIHAVADDEIGPPDVDDRGPGARHDPVHAAS